MCRVSPLPRSGSATGNGTPGRQIPKPAHQGDPVQQKGVFTVRLLSKAGAGSAAEILLWPGARNARAMLPVLHLQYGCGSNMGVQNGTLIYETKD